MKHPIFSIIIPCYKVEKYIRECLDSVLVQTVPDWEAICVDDGSPDGTGAILDEYAARDKRIKVIHQANGGLSAARNAALEIAQGEWLYYLDSDDLMPPDVLKSASSAWQHCFDADFIRGRLVKFQDGECPHWEGGNGNTIVTDISRNLYGRFFNGYFQQVFFRRTIFQDLTFIGDSWCEERPYGAKCWARGRKIIEMDCVSYGYRERTGSITSSRMELKHVIGNLATTREVLRILTSCGKILEPRIIHGFMASWMEWMPYRIVRELSGTDRKKAWKYWFESLDEASSYKTIGIWWRFTIGASKVFSVPLTPVVLGAFPHWLKLHGFHR